VGGRALAELYAERAGVNRMVLGGLGAAAIPSLVEILARQTSLEIIPIFVTLAFAGLSGLYELTVRSGPKALCPLREA
jgi:hypothetical protein